MTTPPEAASAGQSLSNLRAVVTGAAGGIGLAIALQLIAQGAVVHALDRDAAAFVTGAAWVIDGGKTAR